MYLTLNLALLAGFALDSLFGNPGYIPNPVSMIRKLTARVAKYIRRKVPEELYAGIYLVAIVGSIALMVPLIILSVLQRFNPHIAIAVEIFFYYQIIMAKSLKTNALQIYDDLRSNNLEMARKHLSEATNKETKDLSREGIIKKTIEMVAKNTVDNAVGPLFFMAIGGAPLGFLYLAISTLDSMVGFKSPRYAEFGKFAAKLDDAANFLPARIGAILMIGASAFLKLDAKNAFKTFIRDRNKHQSINSGQTQAACAGALNIQLGGDDSYGSVVIRKNKIGKANQSISTDDIKKSVQLMYATSLLMLIFAVI